MLEKKFEHDFDSDVIKNVKSSTNGLCLFVNMDKQIVVFEKQNN